MTKKKLGIKNGPETSITICNDDILFVNRPGRETKTVYLNRISEASYFRWMYIMGTYFTHNWSIGRRSERDYW